MGPCWNLMLEQPQTKHISIWGPLEMRKSVELDTVLQTCLLLWSYGHCSTHANVDKWNLYTSLELSLHSHWGSCTWLQYSIQWRQLLSTIVFNSVGAAALDYSAQFNGGSCSWLQYSIQWGQPLSTIVFNSVGAAALDYSAIIHCGQLHWISTVVQRFSKFLQLPVATASTVWANQRAEFKSFCNLIGWHGSRSCNRMLQELGKAL